MITRLVFRGLEETQMGCSRLLFFFSFFFFSSVHLCFTSVLDNLKVGCGPCLDKSSCFTNNSKFNSSSIYLANLDCLSTKFSTTKEISYGFYNLTVGQWPNQVNAIGLCRGDINQDACKSCLNMTILNLQQSCVNRIEAVGWSDLCMFRYSNRDILGIKQTTPEVVIKDGLIVANVDKFNLILSSLLNNLSSRAAAGDTSSKYAAGHAAAPDNLGRVYAYAQCTPDLSQQECGDCLETAIGKIGLCYELIKCKVLQPSCTLRYETGSFLNVTDEIDISPPPPPPPIEATRGRKRTIIIVVVASVVGGLLLLLCIWICLRLRKSNMSNWRKSVRLVIQVAKKSFRFFGGNDDPISRDNEDLPPSDKGELRSSELTSEKGKGKDIDDSSAKTNGQTPICNICLRSLDDTGIRQGDPSTSFPLTDKASKTLGMNTATKWVNQEGLTQACHEALRDVASALFKMSNICETINRDLGHNANITNKLKEEESDVVELQGIINTYNKKIAELEKEVTKLQGDADQYKENYKNSKGNWEENIESFKKSPEFREAAANQFDLLIKLGFRCVFEAAAGLPSNSFLSYEGFEKMMNDKESVVSTFLKEGISHWCVKNSLPSFPPKRGFIISGVAPSTPLSSTAYLHNGTPATETSVSLAKIPTKTSAKTFTKTSAKTGTPSKTSDLVPSLLTITNKEGLDPVSTELADAEAKVSKVKRINIAGDPEVGALLEKGEESEKPKMEIPEEEEEEEEEKDL